MRIARKRTSWIAGVAFATLGAVALGAVLLCLASTASGIDAGAIARWMHPR